MNLRVQEPAWGPTIPICSSLPLPLFIAQSKGCLSHLGLKKQNLLLYNQGLVSIYVYDINYVP